MKYKWDPRKRRYVDENGKEVSAKTIRRWADDFAASIAALYFARAAAVVNANNAGTLTQDIFAGWATQTRRDIRNSHRAAAVIAYGGLDQMTDAEWHRADQTVNREQGFFDTFTTGLVLGSVELASRISSRSAQYGSAIYSTYENSVRDREIKANAAAGNEGEERRDCADDPNSCEDCIDAAALDWQPEGSLPEIGDSECGGNCRCFFETRIKGED